VADFIPPVLCERLTNLSRLADRAFIAEPKLDGQGHAKRSPSSVAGRSMLRHPGIGRLRGIVWPFESAIFDGEACAGDGHEGIQAASMEHVSLTAFLVHTVGAFATELI